MEFRELPPNRKVYFASDFHLGIPDSQTSLVREKEIVSWLDSVSHDADTIFLLGDLFDTWFEYKKVIPKGFIRLQGKLAELADRGIKIEIFTGNHDFWMADYFQNEIGAKIHFRDIKLSIGNRVFNIGHGDGLGPGDQGYKFLKSIINNPVAKWLYLKLPPYFGMSIAQWFSQKGQKHSEEHIETYKGEEDEFLVQYALEKSKEEHINFFVFGHRHIPIEFKLANGAIYYNTGDWIRYKSFLVYDGENCQLLAYRRHTEEFIYDQQ